MLLRRALAGPAAIGGRLRTMSREELAWRLRTELRTRAEEAATLVRKPGWNREDIGRALAVVWGNEMMLLKSM